MDLMWLSFPLDEEQYVSTLSREIMVEESFVLTFHIEGSVATITAHLFVTPDELDLIVHYEIYNYCCTHEADIILFDYSCII